MERQDEYGGRDLVVPPLNVESLDFLRGGFDANVKAFTTAAATIYMACSSPA